jgi:diguanylate cyclase (GGDEF)-like protein
VEEMTCKWGNKRIKITISIGVASSESAISLDEIIQNSDYALYEAKRNGRNQVQLFMGNAS